MKAIAIIPARYASTRFPGKILAEFEGRPMIEHVYRRATEATRLSEVFIATEDARVEKAVQAFGGTAIMTSPDCPSGTDRVAEAARGVATRSVTARGVAARNITADVIVNVQGDEPCIHPQAIDDLVEIFIEEPETRMATLCVRIQDREMFLSPNVVKVIVDNRGLARYFSRAPIPHDREHPGEPVHAFKHLGIYAYRPDALQQFVSWPPGRLEQIEKLEQLRALENGMDIRVVETLHDSIGIDTPEELEKLKNTLLKPRRF